MTVTSTTSRVSYTGNGSTTIFSVPFYFLANSHLAVTVVDTYGGITTLVLNTDYTVSGAGNTSGGSITCTTAPAFGTTVLITRNVPATQETDYQSNDPFPAATHEAALDKLTMLVQQQSNTNARALAFPLSDDTALDPTLPAAAARAGRYLAFDANGEPYAGGNLPDQIYIGALAAEPATRTDGTDLQAGDLYFNTTLLRMRNYSGSAWLDVGVPIPLTITVDYFSGNASTTAFTLSAAPAFQNATEVFISGVAQKPGTDYTISGTTITFSPAPPTGTNNIMVKGLSSYAGGVPNDGSVSTSKIADGAVTAAKLEAGYADNRIINGGMRIAQRIEGGSATSMASGDYFVDRWKITKVSTAVVTGSRSTDVPSAKFSNSAQLTVTTADTSIATSDLFTLTQAIEGYNIVDLLGQTFTLQFWVKSSVAGAYSVAFRNNGATRSYIGQYTINAANTWEKKSITVVGGLPTGATWNTTNDIGLAVGFVLMAGFNFQSLAGQWLSGNYVATSSNVNFVQTIGNTFRITGVDLRLGTSCPTDFQNRSYQQELALCQRYYCKTFDQGVAPAQNAGTNGSLSYLLPVANTSWYLNWRFPVEMRDVPTTLTGYNPSAANANWSAGGVPIAFSGSGKAGTSVLASSPVASVGSVTRAHCTAEAEI